MENLYLTHARGGGYGDRGYSSSSLGANLRNINWQEEREWHKIYNTLAVINNT